MMQPMPRVPPFNRPATYEDLVALPDLYVAESLKASSRFAPARPAPQRGEISAPWDGWPRVRFGKDGPGGWWILILPELHLGS